MLYRNITMMRILLGFVFFPFKFVIFYFEHIPLFWSEKYFQEMRFVFDESKDEVFIIEGNMNSYEHFNFTAKQAGSTVLFFAEVWSQTKENCVMFFAASLWILMTMDIALVVRIKVLWTWGIQLAKVCMLEVMWIASSHLCGIVSVRMTLIEREDILDGHKECLMGALVFFCYSPNFNVYVVPLLFGGRV